MASPAELPDHVREFIDLSKAYLRQETVEPAKHLGRYAGYSFAAAFAFALGSLFLGIAGMRWIVRALPDGPNWTALGYLIAVAALIAIAAIIIALTARDTGGDS